MKAYWILLLCLMNVAFAQVVDIFEQVEHEEQISDDLKQELAEQVFFSTIRLNINTLTPEQMSSLGLNNFQQFSLKEYIRVSGQILSLNELKYVNGFDSLTINSILPYLYAEENTRHSFRLDSILLNGKHSILAQIKEGLQTPKGYESGIYNGYLGDKLSSTLRYNLNYYDKLEFSLVCDKDAGEPWRYRNKIYGYDHYAISLTLRDITKRIKQVSIGDFRLNIGEGLAMKQSFDISYFSTYGLKNRSARITPFHSSTEYNYNRGLAIHLDFNKIEIIPFVSYHSMDFNGNGLVSSGYHRTQREISYKDSIEQLLYGATIQYINKGLNLGLTGFAYHFSLPIVPNISTYPYMQHYFRGKYNNILSINGSYNFTNSILFFETARSKNNAYAYLVGYQYYLGYKSSINILFRDYSKSYQNYFASAIGLHDNNQNEKGAYLDFTRRVNGKFSYHLGVDAFYFPFITYGASQPSLGQRLKFQSDYSINKSHLLNLYLSASNQEKDCNNGFGYVTQMQAHMKYRLIPSKNWTFTFRAGYLQYLENQKAKDFGVYCYQETKFKPEDFPLSFSARYTFFYTTSYNSRIYLYETSLPLNYSSIMLNSLGHRANILLTYKMKRLRFVLNYNFVIYPKKENLSSGLNLIKGNIQQFLAAQVLFKF